MEGLIQTITVYAIPVLLAITLHEAAHGYVARMFGDTTAYAAGRVTLNPIKHIDPIGTIVVPAAILLLAKLAGGPAFLFGWAKPVPVNFNGLRHPKRDMLWVAAAGPGANVLMAIFWGLVIQLGLWLHSGFASAPLVLMGAAGIFINIILASLNLIPLPPLDGGRIAVSLLPAGPSMALARLEPYGLFILIALMFTGILGSLMSPIMGLFLNFTALVTGLNPAQVQMLIFTLLS